LRGKKTPPASGSTLKQKFLHKNAALGVRKCTAEPVEIESVVAAMLLIHEDIEQRNQQQSKKRQLETNMASTSTAVAWP